LRLLARALLFAALVCVPFVLLALGQRRREGLIWLMFPFLWGVPLMLGALVVFAPLERALDERGLGHWKDVGVPLAGAALVAGVFALVAMRAVSSGNPHVRRRAAQRFARHPVRQVLTVAAGAVPGAVAGALWRLTDWAATWAAALGIGGSP
jgi:hypothetical protein